MATKTDSRFLKVDGAFERPGQAKTKLVNGVRIDLSTGQPYVDSAQGQISNQTVTGSQGGLLPNSPTQSSAPNVSGNPMDSFNNLMLGLLNSAKGVNTADLLKRKRELERESISRTSAPTDKELRTLSPAQQSAIRSGSVNALSPELDANAYELEKANQSIDNFFKVFEQAQKVSQDFADKMVAPDSVIQNAKKVIESDPDMLSTILSGFNDKSKQKIIESLDYGVISAAKTAAKASGGGSSNQSIDNERALFSQFRGEPITKNYNEVLNKKLSVERIIQSGVGGPGDLALVFEFMKSLDPNSVVRETEYAAAAKSGNIFAGAFARFNGYLKEKGGFLPPNVQQAFLSLVNTKFSVAEQQYSNLESEYRRIAESQGLNPDNVIVKYQGAAPGTGSTGTTLTSEEARTKFKY